MRSWRASTGEREPRDIVAALWPERCDGLVSVSGYLIGSQAAGKLPLPPEAEQQWWYQYYFATERGRAGYDKYRREFAKLIWRTASPKWDFDDATFDRSAASFDNPDHVAIAIHNYRWRLGLAEGEARVRRAGEAARRRARHHRAHDHARGRRQRRTTSGSECICREVLGPVFAPDHRGRHRAQPSRRKPPRRSPTPSSTLALRNEPVRRTPASRHALAQRGPPARLRRRDRLAQFGAAHRRRSLRGKVVLVDFWTYTCINWLRTLAYVRAWAEKYRDQGLVVVGVHTPEFPFERDVDNVRRGRQRT